MKTRFLLATLALPLLVASCVTADIAKKSAQEEGLFFKQADYSALPGWQADQFSQSLVPLQKSCARLMKKDKDADIGSFAGKAADWQAVCEKMSLLLLGTDAEAKTFFEDNFTPYQVFGDQGGEGLFTGYYEPQLKGSREKKAPYLTPLYGRPADLVTVNLGDFREDLKGETIMGRVKGENLVPYYDRSEIEGGALDANKDEIIWVDHPVDAFFLHIQGSGQVVLENGDVVHVGYAAQNGHPYLAIGKAMLEKGYLQKDNVSMQSIRAWLEANPDKAAEVMNLNRSYVFFRTLKGEGPLGAEGVALTPGRSMAVDRKKIPYGLPVFIDAAAPEGEGRLQRLMVAQDTGGAIRGAVRGDFFWGAGSDAAHQAGIMKSKGEMYVLLPKSVVVPEKHVYNFWKMTLGGQKGFNYNP
jgi:membrane-bound lytic murein transglycosylase A